MPYKIYAVEAGAAAVPLMPFAIASLAARLIRFALTSALAAGAAHLLAGRFGPSGLARLHVAFWVLFYTAYFVMMSN